MAHRILRLSESTFDEANTFTVNTGKRFPATCSLHMDKVKRGDGILWIMQHGACLKASYSQEERDSQKRLNEMKPIQNGEIVQVGRNLYTVKVLGDYSDCAVLDPVAD